jgi:hypothetical protein
MPLICARCHKHFLVRLLAAVQALIAKLFLTARDFAQTHASCRFPLTGFHCRMSNSAKRSCAPTSTDVLVPRPQLAESRRPTTDANVLGRVDGL